MMDQLHNDNRPVIPEREGNRLSLDDYITQIAISMALLFVGLLIAPTDYKSQLQYVILELEIIGLLFVVGVLVLKFKSQSQYVILDNKLAVAFLTMSVLCLILSIIMGVWINISKSSIQALPWRILFIGDMPLVMMAFMLCVLWTKFVNVIGLIRDAWEAIRSVTGLLHQFVRGVIGGHAPQRNEEDVEVQQGDQDSNGSSESLNQLEMGTYTGPDL